MVAEITRGEDREVTTEDIVAYVRRRFADPLWDFGNSPYGHRLAAFHNHMAML